MSCYYDNYPWISIKLFFDFPDVNALKDFIALINDNQNPVKLNHNQ